MDENFKIKAGLIISGLPPGEYSTFDLHEFASQRMGVGKLPPTNSGSWTHVLTMLIKHGVLERTKKRDISIHYRRELNKRNGKTYTHRRKRSLIIYRRTDKDLILPERVKEEALRELYGEKNSNVHYVPRNQ